jgi:hypothetical protein
MNLKRDILYGYDMIGLLQDFLFGHAIVGKIQYTFGMEPEDFPQILAQNFRFFFRHFTP